MYTNDELISYLEKKPILYHSGKLAALLTRLAVMFQSLTPETLFQSKIENIQV